MKNLEDIGHFIFQIIFIKTKDGFSFLYHRAFLARGACLTYTDSEPLPSGFRACFVLKFMFQRREGIEKGGDANTKTNRPNP